MSAEPIPANLVESNVRLALALGRIAKAFGYQDGECEPELLALTVELFVATLTPCQCGHDYRAHRTSRCARCPCDAFTPVPWGSSAHKRIEYQRATCDHPSVHVTMSDPLQRHCNRCGKDLS